MSLLTRLWHMIVDPDADDRELPSQAVRDQADVLRDESEQMIRVIDRHNPTGNFIQDMATGRYRPRERNEHR